MDFILCLSGIQVRLVNLPRGENIRDAQISRSLQSWLETYLPNGYNADFVYLYNRVTVDIHFEAQTGININDENDPASPGVDPSPRVSGHSGAQRVETSDIPISDNERANSQVQHPGISADDSEVDLPRTPRRRMKKRNRKCSDQHRDSSSENEEHPRPLKRRRQKSPAETRGFSDEDSELPGQSGTRKELAVRKRKRDKNRNTRQKQRTRKADKSPDCEEEPNICQLKGKTSKHVSSFLKNTEEIVPSPSRQRKRQNRNKRKHVTLHDKYPSDDSERSGEEFVPCGRRKRSRKEKKKVAKDENN